MLASLSRFAAHCFTNFFSFCLLAEVIFVLGREEGSMRVFLFCETRMGNIFLLRINNGIFYYFFEILVKIYYIYIMVTPALNRIVNSFSVLALLFCMVLIGGTVLHIRDKGVSEASASVPYTLPKMDGALFKDMVKDSYTHPVFLMVYASWCPHCKRMFRGTQ